MEKTYFGSNSIVFRPVHLLSSNPSGEDVQTLEEFARELVLDSDYRMCMERHSNLPDTEEEMIKWLKEAVDQGMSVGFSMSLPAKR